MDLSSSNTTLVIVVGVIAIVALAMAVVFRGQVLAADEGTEKMQEIAAAVQEGASASSPGSSGRWPGFAVLAVVLLFLLPGRRRDGRSEDRPLASSSSSARCSPPSSATPGMWLATRANVRVAAAARETSGREPAMRIAFRTGGVVGFLTVGLGLLGAALVVLIYKGDAPTVLEGFGFGAALLAMFMRVGGGIFTKAADVGADLVGKVEQGIPEDDPRNAATIADNVGDNVGDCAGMAADLFESYAVTLVAALILGKAAFGEEGLVFPLIVPAIGVDHRDHRRLHHPAARRRATACGDQPRLLHLGRDLGGARARSPRSSTCRRRFAELTGVPSCDRRADDGDPRLVAIGAVIIGIVLAAVIQALTGYFTETEHAPGARTSARPR